MKESNSVFKFKQFEVIHLKNAQKVSTDSVLLGAWFEVYEGINILDIGSGSGVLSLMAAQRFPNVKIVAVEKERDFFEESVINFTKSKFSSRIEFVNSDIRELDRANFFDHIICNPPYFDNALLSDNMQKNFARHNVHFSLSDLFKISSNLLGERGKISVVFPFRNLEEILALSSKMNFYLSRKNLIYHTPESACSLVLAEFSKDKSEEKEESLIIKDEGKYSRQYQLLLKDFLTIF